MYKRQARCTLLVSCLNDLNYCVVFVDRVGVFIEQVHKALKVVYARLPSRFYLLCLPFGSRNKHYTRYNIHLKRVWTLRSIFFTIWQNVSLSAVSDTSFCWEVLRSQVSETGECVYSLCYGRCRKRSGNIRVQRESLMMSKGIIKWPMLGKRLPNSEREMFTRTCLSLWYPFQSLENKTQRCSKQILPMKKNKMRQIVWETQTGECLAIGTLHSCIHFLFCHFILLFQLHFVCSWIKWLYGAHWEEKSLE